MYIDEIGINQQQNKFYTNNPDEAIYTNNPDEEENMNKNKNKLFFDDNNENDNDKNEGLIEEGNDNSFTVKKDIINNDINNKKEEKNNKELSDSLKGDLINEEKKEKDNIEIDLIPKNTDDEKINKENEQENKKQIILIENNNDEINIQKKEKEKEMENEKKIIKKKPKKILQESNESNNENNSLVESLLRNNNNVDNNNSEQNIERKNKNIRKIILSIIFGQFLALLSVGNGFFAKKIQGQKEEKGKEIVIPLLLNSTYYIFLFFVYFFISKCKIGKPRLIYIILSLSDTQANFINVFVFSFGNFKFYYPFIMNILSTIWAVVFTLILLRIYKYLKMHIFGLILCLIGVFAMLLGSFNEFNKFIEMFKEFDTDVKGLLLCLVVSILYGLNAVLIEKYISTENDEIKSYCIWLGIFGFCISALEALIPIDDHQNEYKILFYDKKDNIDISVIIFWILSAVCLTGITTLSPLYIQKFQATMFNISLVFTVFWSYILDPFFNELHFEWHWLNILYFIGFIIIIIGTVIFSLKDRVKRNNSFSYA